MRCVWSNAKKVNQPGSDIWKTAEYLARCWERKFVNIRSDPDVELLWGENRLKTGAKKSPRIRERDAPLRKVQRMGITSNISPKPSPSPNITARGLISIDSDVKMSPVRLT